MRRIALALVLTCIIAGALLYRRARRGAVDTKAPSPTAAQASTPEHARAPLAPSRLPPPLTVFTAPASLADVEQRFPRYFATLDERGRGATDRHLKMINYVNTCVQGRVQSRGEVSLFFQWYRSKDRREWIAGSVTPNNDPTPFSKDELDLIINCAGEFFEGWRRPYIAGTHDGDGDTIDTGTGVSFPIEDDFMVKQIREAK